MLKASSDKGAKVATGSLKGSSFSAFKVRDAEGEKTDGHVHGLKLADLQDEKRFPQGPQRDELGDFVWGVVLTRATPAPDARTIEQIADQHGGLPVEKVVEGGLEIGGLFVGKRIAEGLFAEPVQSDRWLIRSDSGGETHPRRVGEVMGSGGKYLACTMKGDILATKASLVEAGRFLATRVLEVCDEQG
ncbi:hypothetical protein [Ottowia sp.]|uniref:hypothetical protein n=1 Tax=Ottowia sp. TaxID=1898956 RepID=UPI0025FBDA39|nr:hypothetical protein [Ottowia sp.]MBK6616678.1 hypothetical protein [Ottowia sp.]